MILTHGANSLKAGGEPPLPPEYQRLEYIRTTTGSAELPEMSGGGIQLDYTDTIEGRFLFTSPINSTQWLFFFYTWSMNERSFKIEGDHMRSKLAWASYGESERDTNFTQGDFNFSFSVADGLKINGVAYPSNVGTNDGVKTLGRLAHFNNSQNCNMYGYVVRDSANNLKYNFVPALRILDNKTGLYDTVNNRFITPVRGWEVAGPAV